LEDTKEIFDLAWYGYKQSDQCAVPLLPNECKQTTSETHTTEYRSAFPATT